MLTKKEQALVDVLEPFADKSGVELVSVEIAGAKNSPTIRVFIDTETGVSFDELASTQSWVSDLVEQMDPFPGAYTLEVSSPGINRPLRKLEHFIKHIGEEAKIEFLKPVGTKTKHTALIKEVCEDKVVFEIASEEISFSLDDI